ncbi:hypothetical protein [uncultured Empedobacter sp.]|uniref:hypothetical protein n=1 Tax=uncultured Empedobacter sp. TaxID=410844 RepID=UPI0025D27C7D|nr:hypothetical protein [uncultured Empedobacter sp.]
MKSELKTESCDKWCDGCELYTDKTENYNSKGFDLCDSCNDVFEDKTGYCSLSCCLGNGCDQTC